MLSSIPAGGLIDGNFFSTVSGLNLEMCMIYGRHSRLEQINLLEMVAGRYSKAIDRSVGRYRYMGRWFGACALIGNTKQW